MVRHGHPESLSRIDVSSRVVVTLGVFLLSEFLNRRDCGEEEEGDVKRAENLLFWISGEVKLHCAVALGARTATDWQCVSVFFDRIWGDLLPSPLLLLHPGLAAADALIVALPPSSGVN